MGEWAQGLGVRRGLGLRSWLPGPAEPKDQYHGSMEGRKGGGGEP